MDDAIIARIAQETAIPENSVGAAASLFEKGATGPFIVYYRKEATGGLDENKVRLIQERLAYYREANDQRNALLKLLSEQGKLTDELRAKIEAAITKAELEDLQQQFKPKKKTRAAEAIEKGLEPLAEYFWNQEVDAWSVEEHVNVFVNPEKGILTREQALQGAVDIIAEWIWGNAEYRKALREMLWSEGSVVSSVVPAKVGQKTKYNMYYDRREAVTTIPSHRVLAIRRGCKEGILISSIEGDSSKFIEYLFNAVLKEKDSIFSPILEAAVRESYNRILRPWIETKVRTQLKERADREAIRVFQENLANLLLSPPAGPIVVMGIDWGKGDECSVAVVNEAGKFLEGARVKFVQSPKAEQPEPAEEKIEPALQPAEETPQAASEPQAAVEPESAVEPQAVVESITEPAPETAAFDQPQEEIPAVETPAAEISAPEEPAAEEISSETSAEASSAPEATEAAPAEAAPFTEVEAEKPVVPAAEKKEKAPVESSAVAVGIEETRKVLLDLIDRYKVQAISIGTGVGARELETTVRQIVSEAGLTTMLIAAVNDAGIAIYSSSRIAREEFPDWSASARCAVSLARRLQDPLAELVKIDPKLIGVGQYQHDVDQKELHRGLLITVQYCVNKVGVNPNAAGESILRYASGLNEKLARRIVAHRSAQGQYPSRASIMSGIGMDESTFRQCAGFLRIPAGENALDRTAVHPESYPIVEKMAASLSVGIAELIGNKELIGSLKIEDFITESAGIPTLNDIREELMRPGRDPRKSFKVPQFRADVREMADLKPGMTLEGTVTNVTNFGAFVDIGVRQDGLVHLSQMSNRFIRDPREAVKVGDVVQVKVISVETETKRIGLSIKALLPTLPKRRKKQQPHRPGNAPAQAHRHDETVNKPADAQAASTEREPGAGGRPRPNRPHEGPRHKKRPDRKPERAKEGAQDKDLTPKGPEPSLQEKIAILQSKFRRIN